MKGNTVWAPFTDIIQLHLEYRDRSQERVRIETCCLCFKMMHIDWGDIKVTGISGIEVDMPTTAKVSIFMDNDLTNINDDHFKINLIAHLLNQIYIVPSPPPRYDYYDDPAEGGIGQAPTSTATGATTMAPSFSFTVQ